MGGLRQLPGSPGLFFVLDFLLPALPGAVAHPKPNMVEPLVGRNPVPGVNAGHFNHLFPAHPPSLGAPRAD